MSKRNRIHRLEKHYTPPEMYAHIILEDTDEVTDDTLCHFSVNGLPYETTVKTYRALFPEGRINVVCVIKHVEYPLPGEGGTSILPRLPLYF